MNRYEMALAVSFLVLYFSAFGLYHLMVSKVNRQLPRDRRIPHSLSWGHWNRLGKEYKGLFPTSPLYQITVSCTVAFIVLAAALLALRIWEHVGGK